MSSGKPKRKIKIKIISTNGVDTDNEEELLARKPELNTFQRSIMREDHTTKALNIKAKISTPKGTNQLDQLQITSSTKYQIVPKVN